MSIMILIVNGTAHEHRGDGTLNALLAELGAHSEQVAIIVNDKAVKREERDPVRLAQGDRVEILVFMGGG